MTTDYNQQIQVLGSLIEQLKDRCSNSESLVRELQNEVAELQEKLKQTEAEKAEIDMKYQHLQAGLGATGGDPTLVQQLKEQYLAMVSEIDACIATLQHG